VLRRVTINSKPWANYTVDDDPTQHETPSTIELAPGTHRLHFSNPISHIEKDATLTVPADRDLSHVEQLEQ